MSLLPMPNQGGGLLGGVSNALFGNPQSQAITSIAAALLGSRGNFRQALGEAGMAGMQAYNSGMAQQAADRFRQMQMEQMGLQNQQAKEAMERQRQIQEAARLSMIPPQQLPGNEMESQNQAFTGDTGMTTGRFDMRSFVDRVMRVDPMQGLELQKQMRGPGPVSVAQGAALVDPSTGRTIFQNPKEAEQSALAKLIAERESLPQGSPMRAIYDDAIRKASTQTPPMSLSVGLQAPVPVQLPGGGTGYVQPANKPGAEPQLLTIGGQPARRPVSEENKLTEAQAKAATFQRQMLSAERELGSTPIDMTRLWSQLDVGLAGGLTNPLSSAPAQRARQAQEQWAESFLRFKTGAAATKDEVALNVRTFFPQPGDSAAVVQQKARMRQQAMQDIATAAGPGAVGVGSSNNRPAAGATNDDPLGLRGR